MKSDDDRRTDSPPPEPLDALWDFGDPAASEQRFRTRLAALGSEGGADERVEILTQIARAQGLQQRFDDGHSTLDEAESLSPAAPFVQVRSRLERGRLYNSARQPDRAAPHFEAALDLARRNGLEFLAVDAAHMLAIVETGERSLEWNRQALAMAEQASEPRARRWRGALWNNVGWALHSLGRHADAQHAFEQHLAIRTEEGNDVQAAIARWSIAKMLRHLDRPEEALAILEELHARAGATGDASEGYAHEEIGNCLAALDRGSEAAPHFARAWELLHDDPWLKRDELDRLERLRRLGGIA